LNLRIEKNYKLYIYNWKIRAIREEKKKFFFRMKLNINKSKYKFFLILILLISIKTNSEEFSLDLNN
jgi:hypothetical protein